MLREHVDDQTLTHKGDTQTQAVHTAAANTAYRDLRIRMTDLNSNKHWYLALAGFEVYGDLQ